MLVLEILWGWGAKSLNKTISSNPAFFFASFVTLAEWAVHFISCALTDEVERPLTSLQMWWPHEMLNEEKTSRYPTYTCKIRGHWEGGQVQIMEMPRCPLHINSNSNITQPCFHPHILFPQFCFTFRPPLHLPCSLHLQALYMCSSFPDSHFTEPMHYQHGQVPAKVLEAFSHTMCVLGCNCHLPGCCLVLISSIGM